MSWIKPLPLYIVDVEYYVLATGRLTNKVSFHFSGINSQEYKINEPLIQCINAEL